MLVVIDGAKALRKAVRDVLRRHAPVQRCVRHYADSRVMPTGRREAACAAVGGLMMSA